MTYEIAWRPNSKPQRALLSCPAFEVMFGGARGGGKTSGMIGEFAAHAGKYGKDAVGLMLRRERTQLLGTIAEADSVYHKLGARWKDTDKTFVFPNGARLQMGYLERDADAEAWQGRNLTRIYVEEIGNFPRFAPLAKLFATLRSPANVPARFRCTANPGGPGHSWCKARYIDPAPSGMVPIVEEIKNPLSGEVFKRERVYIPSRVSDNVSLSPDYVANLVLSGAGSPALIRAWLEGDWNAIEGAFFSEWAAYKHVIRPFEVPYHWTRFRAIDWGTARPFSIGWYTVASEDFFHDGRMIRRGSIIRYREYYGARRDHTGQTVPNEGVRLPASEVAQRIIAMSEGEPIEYTVIDPATFSNTGGQTIAEAFMVHGIEPLLPADNTRVAKAGAMSGWNNCRTRLAGDDPSFFVFDSCPEFIRTVPVLQHDRLRAEDLDSAAEDHIADEWRYALNTRPHMGKEPEKAKPMRDVTKMTAFEMFGI
jgi:hypothetical protein